MAEYLTGTELRDRIRNVMSGRRPRMCVAFLGPNWVDEVFGGALPPKAKVICDVRMGATVRAALEAGGAPNNERLRHLSDFEMHAKVYLSDEGAVVSSANATRAALSGADRIEDGIWVKAGSATYQKIRKQFTARYEEAKRVDQAALDGVPVRLGGPGLPPGLTLVEALRRNSDAFQGIYFVCSTESVDRGVRDAADRRLEEEAGEAGEAAAVMRPGQREHFANWDREPADWPALFFSVYRGPRGGFSLSKHDSSNSFSACRGKTAESLRTSSYHAGSIGAPPPAPRSAASHASQAIKNVKTNCGPCSRRRARSGLSRVKFFPARSSRISFFEPDEAWPVAVDLTTIHLS